MAKGTWIALGVVAAIALVALGIVGSGVSAYNGLVRESEAATKQQNVVGSTYDAAFEKLPKLVELTQRYMANESDIVTRVAALRTGIAQAKNGTFEQQETASEELRNLILVVGARAENYPELRGAALFQQTMDELSSSVNKVLAEKIRYNDLAQTYNTHRRECCIPALVASMFGFEAKPYIGARDPARTIEDLQI